MTTSQTPDWNAVFRPPTSLSVHNSTYPFIDPAKYRGKLDGKTAIVTGAGQGIGKEIARSLAAAGANVVLVGRRPHLISDVASEINTAQFGRALAVPCDVTDMQAIKRVIAETIQHFGAIDILVNNASQQIMCHEIKDIDVGRLLNLHCLSNSRHSPRMSKIHSRPISFR